ncbi:MAG: PIN domain nuclease [Actinobacteria bacterium]|nr:PIN domain nuclease [Actinomycetota bacterium]
MRAARAAGRGSAGRPEVLVLDAGAFVAVERGDRDTVALIKRERLAGRVPVSHGGVVAQVWRGGTGRQVPVARLLAGVDVAALDDGLGRRAGMLLARAGLADAIDAAIMCLAGDGDDILTSDPGDLRALARAAGVHVELIPV